MTTVADAGVFKQRGGSKPAAAPAAKKPAPQAPAKKAAPAPAKKATPVAAKAPAKKKGSVAASGRPDDLTPDEEPAAPAKKKGKKGDEVTITVEDEDDVIIRDIDD